jgi:hypothetical protein
MSDTSRLREVAAGGARAEPLPVCVAALIIAAGSALGWAALVAVAAAMLRL